MEDLEKRIRDLEYQLEFVTNNSVDLLDRQNQIIKYLDYLAEQSNENIDSFIQKIKTMDPNEDDWTNLG